MCGSRWRLRWWLADGCARPRAVHPPALPFLLSLPFPLLLSPPSPNPFIPCQAIHSFILSLYSAALLPCSSYSPSSSNDSTSCAHHQVKPAGGSPHFSHMPRRRAANTVVLAPSFPILCSLLPSPAPRVSPPLCPCRARPRPHGGALGVRGGALPEATGPVADSARRLALKRRLLAPPALPLPSARARAPTYGHTRRAPFITPPPRFSFYPAPVCSVPPSHWRPRATPISLAPPPVSCTPPPCPYFSKKCSQDCCDVARAQDWLPADCALPLQPPLFTAASPPG